MARSPRTVGRRLVGRIGRSRLLIALSLLGPGLIAANAGNDAGGITTWSVIGARYGYSLLWLLVPLTLVLAVVQEMNARVGVVTGRGLAALIRENFSLRVTAFAILATMAANFGTSVAEFSGVAAAGGLFGVPSYIGVPTVAVAVWVLVTRGSYRKVERVLLALGFVLITYIVSGVLAGPDWMTAARGLTRPQPSLDSLWLFTVVAAVGTTLTPWGQFFIQAAIVDRKVPWKQYVYTKYEIYFGSVFMTTIDFFIVVACAATSTRRASSSIRLKRRRWPWSRSSGPRRSISSASACSASRSSPPGCCPWPRPTSCARPSASSPDSTAKFREAPVFNGIITFYLFVPALVAMIPGLPLVAVIMVAQMLNGVLLPVILVFTLLMINNPRVMGEHVNGPVRNVIAWGFSGLLIILSAILLVSPLFS